MTSLLEIISKKPVEDPVYLQSHVSVFNGLQKTE